MILYCMLTGFTLYVYLTPGIPDLIPIASLSTFIKQHLVTVAEQALI
jgi:hypothetical protein